MMVVKASTRGGTVCATRATGSENEFEGQVDGELRGGRSSANWPSVDCGHQTAGGVFSFWVLLVVFC